MNQPQQDTCHFCGEIKKQLIKHLEDGTQTNTTTKVCVNKDCPLKVNLKNLKTWSAN